MRLVGAEAAVPARWRVRHPWLRLAPAAGVLAVALASPDWKLALAGIYLLASLLAALHRPWRPLSAALPGFFADWGAFLICAGLGGTAGVTAAASIFFFLMASALLFRTALELAAIAAAVLPAWFLIRPDLLSGLGPAFGMGLALALTGCGLRATLLGWFSEQLAGARRAERERLAADFHDGPVQTFSSFQIRLAVIDRLLRTDPPAASQEVTRLQALVSDQIAELRAFLEGLRNGPANRDFRTALLALIRNFERDSGMKVILKSPVPADWPNGEAAAELLKIVREALHNVHKHARAAQVELDFAGSEQAVEVAIRDDGAGFPFAGTYRIEELDALKAGPESIKRRVRALGGELTVTSQPGSGSELRIRLPA